MVQPDQKYDLWYDTGQRTYIFPAHFPAVAVAPSFVPYPNPRYALSGGMQDIAGGVS